jgi:hypothetical protein
MSACTVVVGLMPYCLTGTSWYAAISSSFPQTPLTVHPVPFTVSSHWLQNIIQLALISF